MSIFARKMNLKGDVGQIVVLNPPESFESELAALEDVEVVRDPAAVDQISYALAFAITQAELDAAIAQLAPRAEGDAQLWFAYPKKSSKKYTAEFNRDSGWDHLGKFGFEGVRMVAIDQDWSALRFRHVDYIKSLKRDSRRAMSKKGKKRTAKK